MSKSITKAMQIIELFSLENPEWGVSEAARALGLAKSTTSELMAELAGWKLLRTVSARGRYRLGWRFLELSQTLLDTTEFRNAARQVMKDLVAQWRETVHLAVLDGAQAVYVEKLQPIPAVKIKSTRSGARLPAHCSGVGKLLLAHSDPEYVAELLEDQGMPTLTPNTTTTLEGLSAEFEKIREQGYAYDYEETLIGLCCVAAPIYDFQRTVIAAVSISVPAYRFGPQEGAYTTAIREAARRISGNPGCSLEKYRGGRAEKVWDESGAGVEVGSSNPGRRV